MKNLFIITTALLFMTGITANGQMMGQNKQEHHQGMMMHKNRMSQGMTGNEMCPMCGRMMDQNMPMKKYMNLVKMLPDMVDELSLSQQQTVNLIDLQTDFHKKQIDYKAKLKKNRMKLQTLLDNDASSEEVRTQMEACSKIKINMKLAAYETAKKMKNELTAEQKSKLEELMHSQMKMMQGRGVMMQNRMNQ